MKKEDVLACSFSAWYSQFKDMTIKSYVLAMPKDFVDYLLADGLVLPESALEASHLPASCSDSSKYIGESDNSDEADWENEDTEEVQAPSFPEFEKHINNAIKALGGEVFPKMNWTAPRDASWISFDHTLKCTCPGDVYLLLKSSDFIVHDLTQPFHQCADYNEADITQVKYELVLRRWTDLQPGMEFRCFVNDKQLIAVCQRHHSQYYEYITESKDDIISDIKTFFSEVVAERFHGHDYVFDIYRKRQGNLLLIDINPFGVVTDGLLFDWQELDDILSQADQLPVFRCVESAVGISGFPYSTYAVPRDFMELASGTGHDKLVDILQRNVQLQNTANDDSSSDDDESWSDSSVSTLSDDEEEEEDDSRESTAVPSSHSDAQSSANAPDQNSSNDNT